MHTAMASDDVTDAIVQIEMHRKEMQKENGAIGAGNEALRRLHELLEQERQALQLHGPGAGHPANIEAVAAEIEKVKVLSGAGNHDALSGHVQGQREKPMPQSSAPNHALRSKGRRTMGRKGS